jgi:hypothetical protein
MMRCWKRHLFALGCLFILVSCDNNPRPTPTPQPCDGKACFTFNTQPRKQCVSAYDPGAQGIYFRATSSSRYSYPNGDVVLVYDIEKRREDFTVIGYTPAVRIAPSPGDDGPLSCDVGRETVGGVPNSKVLYFVRPLCATSKTFLGGADCTNRPPEEKFDVDFRHPPLFSVLATDRKAASTLPIDCKVHCKPGAETPLCERLAVPPRITRIAEAAGIDWRQVLTDLRAEIINEKNFPISPARQEQILKVKPSDYGRGGDIFLRGDQIGQDGDAGPLPFVFDDNGKEITADILVGSLIIGERRVVGDVVEWVPDPQGTVPTIKFPDPAWNVLFGGPLSQMHLSPSRFVLGNASRCLAVDY